MNPYRNRDLGSEYQSGIIGLISDVKDFWLNSGMGLLNPNNPAYKLSAYEDQWKEQNPDADPRSIVNDPGYMDLLDQSAGQMIDPGAMGKIAKVAKSVAPSVKSNIKYEDPTGLLDFSKLETDYPNIPQTREPLFVPQKPKVSDELMTFQSPEQQKKLTDWMEAGMKTGGMAWYNTNPLKKFAESEFGEKTGGALYDRFMRYVAALSPNTAPVPNIKQASYYNTLDEAGVPLGVFREGELQIPKGYGRLSMKGVDKTLAAAQNPTMGPLIGPKGTDIKTEDIPLYAKEGYSGIFGATAPKVGRFYQNLTGNIEDMATLDAGAMRAMAGKTDPKYITEKNKTGKRPSAQKEIYDQLEVAFNEFAQKQGVPSAAAQAAIWTASAPYTGVGKKTAGLREGASFMEMLMQRVQITAKELNMKPKDVLKGVLQGNTVLKNMVGPVAAGAIAQQGLIGEDE